MAPRAGHNAALYVSGASVAVVGGAMSVLSGNTYIINEITERWIDPDVAVTVKENGSATAQNVTINRLDGTVDFPVAPATPVTIDYNYLAKARVGCVRSWSFNRTRTQLDRTCMKLQGETDFGVKKRLLGLKDANGSVMYLEFDTDILGSDHMSPDETLAEQFELATKDDYWVLEINIADSFVIRAYVVFESHELSAEVDSIIEGDFSWNLGGPEDGELGYSLSAYQADIP